MPSYISVNITFLTVPPICRPGQKTIYSTGRQETAKVACEVEANPYDITFHWKFNKTLNAMEFIDIPPSHIAVDRLKATAHYTPLTEHVIIFDFYAKSFSPQQCQSFKFLVV